jgi:uncharacterized membrane protein YesL
MTDEKKDSGEEKGKPQEISALSVLGSVFRAWFGVQKEENRQRDFSSNNPVPFIVAGIIFAVLMVIGVIIAVNLALAGAGK